MFTIGDSISFSNYIISIHKKTFKTSKEGTIFTYKKYTNTQFNFLQATPQEQDNNTDNIRFNHLVLESIHLKMTPSILHICRNKLKKKCNTANEMGDDNFCMTV